MTRSAMSGGPNPRVDIFKMNNSLQRTASLNAPKSERIVSISSEINTV